MSDNELLLALSDLMDKKIEPLKSDMRDIKITLGNDMMPRLQTIESCYTTTYKRYQAGANRIDTMQPDIDIMKKVIAEHSQKLQAFV